MGLEATLICVDNSEWMRNGDFVPSRLQVQDDAVNAVCRMKTRLNVENSVGLLTLADTQVRVTLTNEANKIFKALQAIELTGSINFVTGIRIAHLALKHRQNRNQKMRIVAFIGSPITTEEKDMIRLAKRLKKEKVSMDIVNFGEDELNTEKLSKFVDTLNGKDQTSHLVTAHPGPLLSEVLLSSPILAGEDGAPLAPMGQGFEFGIDPTEDPELAMALRVSMEEQRQRQEEETRRAQHETIQEMPETGGAGEGVLAQADMASLPYNPGMTGLVSGGVPMLRTHCGGTGLYCPLAPTKSNSPPMSTPHTHQMPPNREETLRRNRSWWEPSEFQFEQDVSAMTEEQQLALALQMSMAGAMEEEGEGEEAAMETSVQDVGGGGGTETSGTTEDKGAGSAAAEQPEGSEDDMSELMSNRDFLRSVLSSLPGVNPEEALQNLEEMTEQQEEEEGGEKK